MKTADASQKPKKELPKVAGGAPSADERLLSDAQYMGQRAADTVARLVTSWRAMPADEFEECARHV